MGSISTFEAWLAANGYQLETFGTFQTTIPQALMNMSNTAAFQKALKDWSIYSNELVWKRNSGVGQFTYYVLAQNKGICITLSDTSSGGLSSMGWLTENRKNILLNAGVFGIIAGMGAIASALGGTGVDAGELLRLALGAMFGAIVGYLNAKKDQLETGAKVKGKTGSRPKTAKVGF